ncbi:MAG: hypothetical protein KF708_04235 [Pirellulales bacterium]|nr:hypothetical protein [Pirellulales bacterium]
MLGRFLRFWHALSVEQMVWWTVWAGVAVIIVALVVLMRTRWGQSRPLQKCAALSLLVHLLLAYVAATVQVVQSVAGPPGGGTVNISSIERFVEGGSAGDIETGAPSLDADDRAATSPRLAPWESDTATDNMQSVNPALERMAAAVPLAAERTTGSAESALPGDLTAAPLPTNSVAPEAPRSVPQTDRAPSAAVADTSPPIDAPRAERQEAIDPLVTDNLAPPKVEPLAESAPPMLDRPLPELPAELLAAPTALAPLVDVPTLPMPDETLGKLIDVPPRDLVSGSTNGTAPAIAGLKSVEVPNAGGAFIGSPLGTTTGDPRMVAIRRGAAIGDPTEAFEHRLGPMRARTGAEHGATPESEAAVQAALDWFKQNQSAEGAWDPTQHGGGRETRTLGHDRQNAGAGAETGVTGLALLAFLGAGHTHKTGDYTETVRRGLDYLRRMQATNGSFAGKAKTYAAMYCHGMALLAIAEAYGMTGDPELADSMRRGVQFTLAAQHPSNGGWRYRPGDLGDTSQLGWQLMALKSAELAGLPMPDLTRERMYRFIRGVTFGEHGGLASYRPGEQASRTMTAEVLVCRQFLGAAPEYRAGDEAASYIAQELPGHGQMNLYYWYYATLGLYQHQGAQWQRWNEAMQTTLLRTQRIEGDLAGSWDPTDVWGGYGGRPYTTALGALCLEVYYRYLPLYSHTAKREQPGEPSAPK